MRKELEQARAALTAFQAKTNMVAPSAGGGDRETSQYMAIAQELSSARASLTAYQSRLSSGSTDLSERSGGIHLQILSGSKQKLSAAEAEVWRCSRANAKNPKMLAQEGNMATLRREIGDATGKMREHLKDRIATT